MKNRISKKQIICVVLAFLLAVCTTGIFAEAKVVRVQKKMAKEVFRFHVLANSDSERDQALKMKVKEGVIAYMKESLLEQENLEVTKIWAISHLDEIERVSEKILRQHGCGDTVVAEVTNCYFPDKTYGDITFPKGNYDALRIRIGEARGQNWWCVLYPNLCFIDAVHAVVPEEGKKDLKKVLDEEEYEMVTATSKFKIRWFFFR